MKARVGFAFPNILMRILKNYIYYMRACIKTCYVIQINKNMGLGSGFEDKRLF